MSISNSNRSEKEWLEYINNCFKIKKDTLGSTDNMPFSN